MSLLPWLAVLAGCDSGGQTGGELAGPALEPPACHVESRDVARSERALLGFSANDVLDYAAGTHEAAALWPIDPQKPERAQGATIALTLTPRGSTAHLIPEHGSVDDCRSHLVIDVRVDVELRHNDASARLSTDATLVASTRDLAILPLAYAPPNEVVGDAMVELPPDTKVLDYAVDAMFSPTGTSGHIAVRRVSSDAPDDAGTSTPDSAKLASWPPPNE